MRTCLVQVLQAPEQSVVDLMLDRAEGAVSARGRTGRGKRSDSSSASNKQVEAYISQVCGQCEHVNGVRRVQAVCSVTCACVAAVKLQGRVPKHPYIQVCYLLDAGWDAIGSALPSKLHAMQTHHHALVGSLS